MGWMQGFITAAGKDASNQNMLDIQTKIEKHKAFSDHMLKLSEDPSYTPEAQQAAKNRWLEAQQAGPMKFKNYDISDILTVTRERPMAGTPRATLPEQNFGSSQMQTPATSYKIGEETFQAPALSTQGPDLKIPQVTGMQAPPQAMESYQRPGKMSPEEIDQQEAAGYWLKMQKQYEMQEKLKRISNTGGVNKTSGRAIPINEKGLAQQQLTQPDGSPYPKGNYYLQWMQDGSARVTATMPTAGRLLSTPMLKDGEYVYMEYDPRTGELSEVGGQGSAQIIPPRTDAVAQQDASGTFWRVTYDKITGKEISAEPFQPSVAFGSTSTGEQYVSDGRDMLRKELMRTSIPKGNATPVRGMAGSSTLAPNAQPQAAPQAQPSVQPQQQQAPVQPAGSQVAPILPPPPPSNRTSVTNRAKQAEVLKGGPLAANPLDSYADTVIPGDPARNIPDAPMLKLNDPNYIPPRDTENHQAIRSSVLSSKNDPRAAVIPRKPALPTLNQLKTWRADESVYRNTLKLLDETVTASNALDSYSGTMKLYFMTSFNPTYKFMARTLLGTNMITKDEYNFAIAYNGLREHIQKMRGPLGAAGFRSLEAFMSLQAQRGEVLDNPTVTKGVLRNSMKTFLSLYGADRWAISEVDRKPNRMDKMTNRWYKNAYKPSGPGIGVVSPEDAEESVLLDGWVID